MLTGRSFLSIRLQNLNNICHLCCLNSSIRGRISHSSTSFWTQPMVKFAMSVFGHNRFNYRLSPKTRTQMRNSYSNEKLVLELKHTESRGKTIGDNLIGHYTDGIQQKKKKFFSPFRIERFNFLFRNLFQMWISSFLA